MDRKKIITAAGTTAAVFAILAAGGTSPSDAVSVTWGAARHAALLTAGIKLPDNTTAFPARNPIFSEEEQPLTEESPPECTEAAELPVPSQSGSSPGRSPDFFSEAPGLFSTHFRNRPSRPLLHRKRRQSRMHG